MDTTPGAAPLQPTMEELARRAVAAAQKCECGAVATSRYSVPRVVAECCGGCCGMRVLAAAETLIGPETYTVTPLPEGKRVAEIARAYGIEGAK